MIDTPNKNNLSNDVVIQGSIKFANEFIFDGNLEGDITSADGVLTVGENANVRGDVKSKIVIVKGKVHGNITVPERCELHAGSQLIGDLKAVRVALEDGATFLGKLEVTPNSAAIRGCLKSPDSRQIVDSVKLELAGLFKHPLKAWAAEVASTKISDQLSRKSIRTNLR